MSFEARYSEFLKKVEQSQFKTHKISVSTGNSKLAQDGIACFDIPQAVTCRGAGSCLGFCYASIGNYTYRVKQQNMLNNFYTSQTPEVFKELVSKSFEKLPRYIKTIRLHSSGDFYNQEYLDTWVEIMEAHPQFRFYAYTKSLDLDWTEALKLKNFFRVQSIGGLFDHLIDMELAHSRIFPDQESLLAAGYLDASESDLPAAAGGIKIGLVVHGQKKKRYNEKVHLSNVSNE
jgi:hypothetical protein